MAIRSLVPSVIPRPVLTLAVGIRPPEAVTRSEVVPDRWEITDCHTSDVGHWFAMTCKAVTGSQ